MIQKKRQQLRQEIRREDIKNIMKKQRQRNMEDVQLCRVFEQLIEFGPQEIPSLMIQKAQFIREQLLRKVDCFSRNLKPDSLLNAKFSIYIVEKYNIISRRYYQKTIDFCNKVIMQKQIWDFQNEQLIESFITYWIKLLPNFMQSKSQSINIMNTILARWLVSTSPNFNLCAQFFIQMIPYNNVSSVSFNFKHILPTLILNSCSKEISKLIVRLIQFDIRQVYDIIQNPSFQNFILRSLNSTQQQQDIKSCLQLLNQILDFYEWSILLKQKTQSIVVKLVQIAFSRGINQFHALFILQRMVSGQRINDLQAVFNELEYNQLFERISSKNVQILYRTMVRILQVYPSSIIYDKLISKCDLIARIVDFSSNSKSDDVFGELVVILSNNMQKYQISLESFIKIQQATKIIDLSDTCFEEIMKIQEFFRQ